MNDDDKVGLSPDDRRKIAAMVATNLAAVAPDAPDEQIRHAITMLVTLAHGDYGHDGVFEVMCAAVDIAAHGAQAMPGRSVVFPALGPGPAEQVVADMGTALVAGDRFTARLHFDSLQPDQRQEAPPTTNLVYASAALLASAWRRQGGAGALNLLMRAGDRWPPWCDFCGGVDAVWMYHCRALTVSMRDTRTESLVQVRLPDSEHWYACRPCEKLIAADPPQLSQLWARHLRFKPEEREARDTTLKAWAAFLSARRTRRPVPLPEARPAGVL